MLPVSVIWGRIRHLTQAKWFRVWHHARCFRSHRDEQLPCVSCVAKIISIPRAVWLPQTVLMMESPQATKDLGEHHRVIQRGRNNTYIQARSLLPLSSAHEGADWTHDHATLIRSLQSY